MYWLSILRFVVLVWASICAIALLGVGAHSLSAIGQVFAWEGLAVATAVLTLVSVPAMLIIDLLRTGAFTSMIIVELAWLGFLGVMMLATGGAAATIASELGQCNAFYFVIDRTVCSETSPAAAFGFLAWLALWAYTITLFVILLIQAHRNNYIWQRSVKEIQLKGSYTVMGPISAPGAFNSDKPHETAALNTNAGQYGYPPQQGALSPQTTGYASRQGYVPPQGTGYNQPVPHAVLQPQPGVLGHPASPHPTNASGYPHV